MQTQTLEHSYEIAIATEIQALRDFSELSSDWFWEQDAQFRFTRFFGSSTDKLRRKQSDFLGKRRWDMPIHGITPEQMAEHIRTCERHEPFRSFDYEIPGEGGVIQYYSISGRPVFDAQGVFTGYRGVGRNITELRLAELALKESERHLSQIVDGSSIATFVIDTEHRVTHWNQACAQLTGLSACQMVGTTDSWRAFYLAPRPCLVDLVVDGASDAVLAEHYPQFRESTLLASAVEAEGFFPHMGRDGRWLYFTAVPLRHTDGRISGAIETLQDITLQRKAQAELEKLASHDGLTCIANRRSFDRKLDDEWHRACRNGAKLSLLMIDIDHFKYYNDTYGHQAGDVCLQQVAKALEQVACRSSDLVARYGGEEFAVILSETNIHGAAAVAKRIIERITELALPNSTGEGGRVTLSIGVACLQAVRDQPSNNLIAAADSALYQAKHAGRNCFVMASEIP